MSTDEILSKDGKGGYLVLEYNCKSKRPIKLYGNPLRDELRERALAAISRLTSESARRAIDNFLAKNPPDHLARPRWLVEHLERAPRYETESLHADSVPPPIKEQVDFLSTVVDIWNREVPSQTVELQKLRPAERGHIKRCWAHQAFREGWEDVCHSAARLMALEGKYTRHLSFGWIIARDENWQKILDGGYNHLLPAEQKVDQRILCTVEDLERQGLIAEQWRERTPEEQVVYDAFWAEHGPKIMADAFAAQAERERLHKEKLYGKARSTGTTD